MLATGGLALLAGVAAGSRVMHGLAAALAASTSLAGATTAAYQSWLQLQPSGDVTCVGTDPSLIEQLVEYLGALAPTLFLATGFCEDDSLRLLGLSLANWALLSFVMLCGLSIWMMTAKSEREESPNQTPDPFER